MQLRPFEILSLLLFVAFQQFVFSSNERVTPNYDSKAFQAKNFLDPCSVHHNIPKPMVQSTTNILNLSETILLKQSRRKRVEEESGIRHEVDLTGLFHDIERFTDFNSFLQNEINTTENIEYQQQQAPYIYFDQRHNHTRLTWCEHNNHHNNISIENDNHRLWESLRNKRIVFIGDSVIRFQYLDLVYFLTHKQWNGHQNRQELVNIYTYHHNWGLFNNITSFQLLHGYEICECYRQSSNNPNIFSMTENRKFYLPELNVTVWMFLWVGIAFPMHGKFMIDEDMQLLSCMPQNCFVSKNQKDNLIMLNNISDIFQYKNLFKQKESLDPQNSFGWGIETAAEFINMFVIAHKPDYVYLTTGFHGALNGQSDLAKREATEFQRNKKDWQEKYKIDTKLIFRATTLYSDKAIHTLSSQYDTDAVRLAKEGIWDYWDVSSILEKMYWVYHRIETPSVYFNANATSRGFMIDEHHYAPWVYSELNKAFIIKYFIDPYLSV